MDTQPVRRRRGLIAGGQTIVYALHQTIGHLGIFVSAKVATKEQEEFARTMDLIDALPPGLYEAVFVAKGLLGTAHAELVQRRSSSQVRAARPCGYPRARRQRRWPTTGGSRRSRGISEVNQGLYRTVRRAAGAAMTTEQSAEWLRRLHPHRVRFEWFSDRTLGCGYTRVGGYRANRKPVATDNPFLALQEAMSEQIVDALDQYRDARDRRPRRSS